MDPWLQALQLHRQRKKKTPEKSPFQGNWNENNHEQQESGDTRVFNRRLETTIERPSWDDETGVLSFESKDNVRKKRKKAESSYDHSFLESRESDHLSSFSERRGRNPSNNVESSGLPQGQSLNNTGFAHNNSVLSDDSSECNVDEASTQSKTPDQKHSSHPQETNKSLGDAKENNSAEEQQKLLEELRRIEEELERARRGTTS